MGFSSILEVKNGLLAVKTAGKMAKKLLQSGWLEEFQLSEKLRLEEAMETARIGWITKPPPKRHKKWHACRFPAF